MISMKLLTNRKELGKIILLSNIMISCLISCLIRV